MSEEKDFFTQQVVVRSSDDHSWAYCANISKDMKVLHVGCSDWPLTSPKDSLHAELQKHCTLLHGADPNDTDIMEKEIGGVYFKTVAEADNYYDVILVPNVLEHASNAGELIGQLLSKDFKKLFVLVPNYSIYTQAKYNDMIFTERVHPDHVAWYSPYTLLNLFRRYMNKDRDTYELAFFDGGNMISILITRK